MFADSGVGVVPVVLGEVAGVAVAVAKVREVGNVRTGAEGHFGDGICADVLANLDYEDVGLLHHCIGEFVIPGERAEVELPLEFRDVGDRIADAGRVALANHLHKAMDIVLVDAGRCQSSLCLVGIIIGHSAIGQAVAKEEDADR